MKKSIHCSIIISLFICFVTKSFAQAPLVIDSDVTQSGTYYSQQQLAVPFNFGNNVRITGNTEVLFMSDSGVSLMPGFKASAYDGGCNSFRATVSSENGRRSNSEDSVANPKSSKTSNDKVTATKYSVSVYPNPTSQDINIVIGALTDGQNATVCLFNNQGKNVITKKQNSILEILELTGVSSGIYLLKVVINDEQIFSRIVKL